MKPQIRISEVKISQLEGSRYDFELVLDKGDKSFERPTESPDDFHYFWYCSNGSYSKDAKANMVFAPSSNQIYETGLILERKKKGPVVKGKTSPTPRPPVDPSNPRSVQMHVNATSSSNFRAATIESLVPLELKIEKQDNLVVAVLTYSRTSETDIPESGYLRISFNKISEETHFSPLMLKQEPIAFHDEWIYIAPPVKEYRQAIYLGIKDLKVGDKRTVFLPFWGIYDEEGEQPKLDLTEEIKVEWLKEVVLAGTGDTELAPIPEMSALASE